MRFYVKLYIEGVLVPSFLTDGNPERVTEQAELAQSFNSLNEALLATVNANIPNLLKIETFFKM